MENKFIDGSTLIGDIVARFPEAAQVLMACGMHCLGCPASRAESLSQACAAHGLDEKAVLEAVNAAVKA